jgi:hypothetical protein
MLFKDYASVVKKPMDFGTVGRKIEKGAYKQTDSFKDDILLIFSNAKLYNYKTDEIWQSAAFLMDTFKRLWPKLEHKFQEKSVDSEHEHEGNGVAVCRGPAFVGQPSAVLDGSKLAEGCKLNLLLAFQQVFVCGYVSICVRM